MQMMILLSYTRIQRIQFFGSWVFQKKALRTCALDVVSKLIPKKESVLFYNGYNVLS
jgi:hypothetical protein